MLGYSVQMDLGPDQWLTVAARPAKVRCRNPGCRT